MSQPGGVQTGWADINGGRLYYEVAGDGPAVVFAHAGIADCRMWDDQFLAFAQYYRVIRCDFWGFGQSAMTNNPFALYQDLYQLLKFLGVERAHLLGCSMGGATCLDLALAYPQMVSALVLVGSGLGGYEFTGDGIQRYGEQLVAARQQNDVEREFELALQFWVDGRNRTPDQVEARVREQVRAMLRGQFRGPSAQLALDPPAVGRLAEIAAPTLIIVGDRDEANIATIADRLLANMPAARKVVFPDAAHLPNMEKPEQFNRVALEFLGSLRP